MSAANIASFVFGAGFSANILNNVLFLRTVWGFGVVKAGLFSALAPIVVAVWPFGAWLQSASVMQSKKPSVPWHCWWLIVGSQYPPPTRSIAPSAHFT